MMFIVFHLQTRRHFLKQSTNDARFQNEAEYINKTTQHVLKLCNVFPEDILINILNACVIKKKHASKLRTPLLMIKRNLLKNGNGKESFNEP